MDLAVVGERAWRRELELRRLSCGNGDIPCIAFVSRRMIDEIFIHPLDGVADLRRDLRGREREITDDNSHGLACH